MLCQIYEQIEAVNAAMPPRPDVKAGVLILTLAASLALWGNLFDWGFAAILVGVLLIHEAGHAIAMRAFGYREISMFFIPFFGAAVTGTEKEMPSVEAGHCAACWTNAWPYRSRCIFHLSRALSLRDNLFRL